MHASKTIRSKPNKQIKNGVAYSLRILFIFKTWSLIRRGTEQLKTMLASPVAALPPTLYYLILGWKLCFK